MRRLVAVLVLFASGAVFAASLPTPEQALAEAFPGATLVRETVFLTREEVRRVRNLVDEDPRELVIRYTAKKAGAVVGYGYFDSHRVRTLMETVMIALTPAGEISRIEVVAFNEPPDYLPRPRWLEQFRKRKLNRDLSLSGAIRPISGATLTSRAIVNAARKVMAIHQVIQARR